MLSAWKSSGLVASTSLVIVKSWKLALPTPAPPVAEPIEVLFSAAHSNWLTLIASLILPTTCSPATGAFGLLIFRK